jgi:parallel beta helix pectate lyase-like protein
MKSQLMNAIAGALTLSIALSAGGAANAAARTVPTARPAATGFRLADDKQVASQRLRAKGKSRTGGKHPGSTGRRAAGQLDISGARATGQQAAGQRDDTTQLDDTAQLDHRAQGDDRAQGAAGRLSAGVSPVGMSVRAAGRTGSWAGATFMASEAGQAGVHVLDAAKVTLTGCVIRKNGSGTAVLADAPSLVVLNGCAITTDGDAHGIHAAGPGSEVRVANSTIRTAAGTYAALADYGGRVSLQNVNVTGGGLRGAKVVAHGGTISAEGSPVLYSEGQITVHGITGTTLASKTRASDTVADTTTADTSTTDTTTADTTTADTSAADGEYAAVITAAHAIDAIDSDLTSPAGILFTSAGDHKTAGNRKAAGERKAAGDHKAPEDRKAAGERPTADAPETASYTMTGGSLTATSGPAFETRQVNARVRVRGGAAITAGNGVLAQVSGGGALTLTASGQGLQGDVISTGDSSAALVLRHGSSLTGTITNGALELDASSTWYVTGDSTMTRLTGETGAIVSNGHTVYATDGTVLVPQNGNQLSL